MARKKNTRMIPREDRRADSLARSAAEAAMTDSQRDDRTIAQAMGSTVSLSILCEAWLGLCDEQDLEPDEIALGRAIARTYKRTTGRSILRGDLAMPIHDFTGAIHFTSGFEEEVSSDPFMALDYSDSGDPMEVALAARIIAGHWHGGQTSALYAFSSSGHLDIDDCLSELAGNTDESARALVDFLEGIRPEDTSEDPCTDHGHDVCPDCGNGGTAIGPNGYYECTRFLTCWADVSGDTAEGI